MNTVNKMLKWIGISDDEEEIYEVEENEAEEEAVESEKVEVPVEESAGEQDE